MLGLLGMVLLVAVGTVVATLAAVAAVVALARLVGGEAGPLLAAGALLVIGTVPATVYAVLWYARAADYQWAIGGPGLFARLGGGPFMAAYTLGTAVFTGICWLAALWLALRGLGEVQDG